jgi:hypothetical protein
MPVLIDYQALVGEKIPYERAIPIEARIALCEPSSGGTTSMPANRPTMLPESHLGIMAVLSDGGVVVPILTASDLLRKLKAIWKDTQD